MIHPQVNAGNPADEGDSYDNPLGYDQADDEFEAEAFSGDENFDEGDAGYEVEGSDEGDAYDDAFGDAFETDESDEADLLDDLDSYDDGFDDVSGARTPSALANSAWSAFEADVADALDAGSTDEFLGSLIGGFSSIARTIAPIAGAASRLGGLARGVGRLGGLARTAGRLGGQAGRLSQAGRLGQAARMASRWFGNPRSAAALRRYGRTARQFGGGQGNMEDEAPPRQRRNAALQDNPIAQLLAQIGQLSAEGADDFEAFDAMADLYEEGVDEALPAAVGLAARLAARALGGQTLAQLSPNARRGFVHGVGTAARHLIQGAGPGGVRALPRIAASSAQLARRQRTPAQRIPNQVGRTATRAARRVANAPRAVRQLSRPMSPTPPIGRASRPPGVGRGVPTVTRGTARRYVLHGPVELTIRPL